MSPQVFHNNFSAKTLKTKTTTTLCGSASPPSRRSYKGSWRRTGFNHRCCATPDSQKQEMLRCSLIFPGISRSINVTKRLAAKRCSYTDMLKRNRAFLSKADWKPPRRSPSPGNPPITPVNQEKIDVLCMHEVHHQQFAPHHPFLWRGYFRQSLCATADYAAMQGCCSEQVVGG